MARVRYLGHEQVTVPELNGRAVQPDEVVEVPDERFEAYVCQTANWEAVEEPPAPVVPDTEPDEGPAPGPAPQTVPPAEPVAKKAARLPKES